MLPARLAYANNNVDRLIGLTAQTGRPNRLCARVKDERRKGLIMIFDFILNVRSTCFIE